jgi:hypothetical protein
LVLRRRQIRNLPRRVHTPFVAIANLGSPGGVCGSLRDPAQPVPIVREQRMFFSKPETGYRCVEL